MGKAKILSELGDGQYKIQVLESRERAESAKGQAESRITENRTAITQLESDIQAAQAEVDRLAGEQSDAIDRFQSGESDLSISDLSEYAEAIAKAAEARDKTRIEKKTKERMIEADQSLIGKVDALPPLREMQAWCADYTDDLSGEVATAEVPGEIGQVIIKPGFEGANQWSPQADGMIQPALSSTPAGTFYNLAMLPGCQKWRPTFRTATLTSVDTDNDTGSISLDSATSSQQGLGVNDQTSFSDVPIEYMDCNGGAFESGDKVLVSFAEGAKSPTVIGFESEPKECFTGAYFHPYPIDVGLTSRESIVEYRYQMQPRTSRQGKYVCDETGLEFTKINAAKINIDETTTDPQPIEDGLLLGALSTPKSRNLNWSKEVGTEDGGFTLGECSIGIWLEHGVTFGTSASGWEGYSFHPSGEVGYDGWCAPGYSFHMSADLEVDNSYEATMLLKKGEKEISVTCRLYLQHRGSQNVDTTSVWNFVNVYSSTGSPIKESTVLPEIEVNGVVASEGLACPTEYWSNRHGKVEYRCIYRPSFPKVRLSPHDDGILINVVSHMFEQGEDSASFIMKYDGETILA